MKKLITILLSLSILSSCVHKIPRIQPHVYATFDASNKTIAVPPKPSGFCSELKERLREHGWQIKTSGLSDQRAERKAYSKSPAKYTLILREKVRAGYNESDYQPVKDSSFTPLMLFGGVGYLLSQMQQQKAFTTETALEEVSATIIDNRTGDEVMTFYAREVLPKLDAKTFADTIAENTK